MMFPPGRGNDILSVSQKYVISLYGTNDVFTAEGEEVRLREYKKDSKSQIWICTETEDNRISMQNQHTLRFLGRSDTSPNSACLAKAHQPWEDLDFTRLSLGGYKLMMKRCGQYQLDPIQRQDASKPGLRIGWPGDQFGLHQLGQSVVRRFEWVVPKRLARSSAPYYDSQDSDQSMNETSIDFLVGHGINRIISLNEIPLSSREKLKLKAAGISYTHVKVPDFAAPTQSQFDQMLLAYAKGGATLIYCGYGDGRTGMAISALQIFQGRKLSQQDYRDHGVQSPSQLTALDALSIRIHGYVSRYLSISYSNPHSAELTAFLRDSAEDDSDSPGASGTEPPLYAVSDKNKSEKR
ncbi:hypothetical protein L873DRAFT_1814074 [Choiromyces venosus 120613-1]|uniref:Swiss Army Knife protein DSP-PTPase phosphatase domain-containing protein n=1 Tax=Choiromyces venosus 120613-1 TaxID=1336337 RepID=A0A3N4JCZ6_9PEZI|nr:hypothetical protein L873DRAFT_1814074 [Choiromyces venosus 120613-1]